MFGDLKRHHNTIALVGLCAVLPGAKYVPFSHCFGKAPALPWSQDGTGLTQYCIGQILLETGRADEAEAKFSKILSGCRS